MPGGAAMWTHAFHGEWWLTLTKALRTEASNTFSAVSTTLRVGKERHSVNKYDNKSDHLDCSRDPVEKDTKMFEEERIFSKEGLQAEVGRLHGGWG